MEYEPPTVRTFPYVVTIFVVGWASLVGLVQPATGQAVNIQVEKAKLADGDAKVATAAARRLGTSSFKAAATVAILDVLALGVHPSVAEASIESLGKLRDPRGFKAIRYYLNHRNQTVRAAAVNSLNSYSESASNPLVLDALRDSSKRVRAAAIAIVERRQIKFAVETLLELMKRGDEATVSALVAMGTPNVARAIGELIGEAPNALVARGLGQILRGPKFGPEQARVDVVRALGKVGGSEVVEELATYVGSLPDKSPRQSKREAEKIIETRLEGDKE